jgi:hypothetical protein
MISAHEHKRAGRIQNVSDLGWPTVENYLSQQQSALPRIVRWMVRLVRIAGNGDQRVGSRSFDI